MDFTTELFDYQKEAVEKLRHTKVGALYMEPGTGKTRTTLELIKRRLDAGKVDAVLWLCPCSVKDNLHLDILYHCGEMPNNIVIKGIESLSSSDALYMDLMTLVNTYDVFLVIDESNLIKNHKAIRTERISELSTRCQYKMILNGTPVSRNEADLFAQWWVLDPGILGYNSYYSFAANHIEFVTIKGSDGREYRTNRVRRVHDVDYLTAKIAPYTYQIRISDTGIDLPAIYHKTRSFLLTGEQTNHYDMVREEYLANVDDFDSTTVYNLFNALQQIASGRRVLTGPKEKMRTEPFFKDWHDNPRMQCLKKCIDGDDEQCIIFCKYQAEIDDIKLMLQEQGRTYEEFTGSLNLKERIAGLKRFRDGDSQYLIANKKCGAYGLNLQFCHNIIFYNNDFEYATREQAEDRIHRIGQTEDCYVTDLMAESTIDSFILDNLGGKEGMIYSFKQWIKSHQKKNEEDLIKEMEKTENAEDIQQ